MGGLLALTSDLIEKNGPLTVASYMELALQHPEHGYYRRHDPLGAQGDFITAPEISQMFGEMVGLWCADVWRQMGAPPSFTFLELGPGRGTLMQDALRATAKIPGFHQAANVRLVESNESLRKMQQEKLVEYLPLYINDLTELPSEPVIVIANEFFDALPIRQFEKTFQGWCERLVTVQDGKLSFMLQTIDPMIANLIPADLREANPGFVYEVSLPSLALVRNLAKHIKQYGGVALIVDYGFVAPFGQATLQAVANHKFANVLANPGEADLTAHVDFSMMHSVAAGQGVTISGPIGQGEFLQALGIELRAVQLKQRTTPNQAADIDAALQRLTDPSQMGTLFKVMAIASPQLPSLAGF